MSVAVLKNRLLDLTERSFQESDYGVATFIEFVRKQSTILDIDVGHTPPIATLKATVPAGVELMSPRTRIRSDLWWAALDFSGEQSYVWDLSDHTARRESEATRPGPIVPTLTEARFNEWKRDFAGTVGDDERNDRIEQWTEQRLPASILPLHVRHRWNEYLKRNVHAHLVAWFGDQGLPPPEDLLQTPSADAAAQLERSEELRRRLLACVRVMTPEELERVQVPSSVLLRTKS